MSNIVIVTESGSDISAAEAAELGVEIVPMHVSIGDVTIDDGSLDPCLLYTSPSPRDQR